MLLDMVSSLEAQIDSRISRLNSQATSLGLNQDTLLDSQALVDVNSSLSILNNWSISLGVDDASLSPLSAERASRAPQITARILAIDSAKAIYYDDRYNSAVNKADLSRGTARIKIFRVDTGGVGGTIDTLKSLEEDRIQAIEDTLTLAGESIPVC